MTEFTTSLHLELPDFNVATWHDAMHNNFRTIDAVLYGFTGITGIVGPWTNSVDYLNGQRVVDTTVSLLYQCNVDHTSAATGTFAEDRASNPTYWTVITAGTVPDPYTIPTDLEVGNDATIAGDLAVAGTSTLQNLDATTALLRDGSIRVNSVLLEDAGDPTKKVGINIAGVTTGNTRSLILPDRNVILDKYISQEIDMASTSSAAEVAQSLRNVGASYITGQRQRLLNPRFDIWQRGNSVSIPSGGGIGADRWNVYVTAPDTCVMSRQAFTPGQSEVPGSPLSYARLVTTGSTNIWEVFQRIEGVQNYEGALATLSFHARVSSGTMTIMPFIVQSFGGGGSANVVTNGAPVVLTTTWQRFWNRFTVPSISGKVIGTNSYLAVGLFSQTMTARTLDFANVEIVNGDEALSVSPGNAERRHPAYEMFLCQRYCEKSYNHADAPGTVTTIGAERFMDPTAGSCTSIKFSVAKRATPTMLCYSPATGTIGKYRDVTSAADFDAGILNAGERGAIITALVGHGAVSEYMEFHWLALSEL